MTIRLRSYQEQAVEAVLKEYKAGINRQIVSLATGSRNTVIAVALARRLNG